MTEPSNENIKKTLNCQYCDKKINKKDKYVEHKAINAPTISAMCPPVIYLYSHIGCFNESVQ